MSRPRGRPSLLNGLLGVQLDDEVLCDFVVDIAALGQLCDNTLQRTGLTVQPCGQSNNGSLGAGQLCKLCRAAAGLTDLDDITGLDEVRGDVDLLAVDGEVSVRDQLTSVAAGLSKAQAEELNIRDGCCFGPVLIMNGEINQEAYNSNSGWNPRTAIGQRKDGAVVFVCIDGRQAGSAGGTYKDVIDIMIEYGVVNACNMDGGSSSIMVYRDTYGLFGEAGTVQVINSYSLLQERPRKMPTFWMVAP